MTRRRRPIALLGIVIPHEWIGAPPLDDGTRATRQVPVTTETRLVIPAWPILTGPQAGAACVVAEGGHCEQ